jgi:hypothetical protein
MVEQILEELPVVPLLLQAMIMMHLSMNTVWAISTDIKSQFFFYRVWLHVEFKDELYYRFLYAGLLRQPKWGHLRDLHRAIKLCEPALVSADPTVTRLGNFQEVYLK